MTIPSILAVVGIKTGERPEEFFVVVLQRDETGISTLLDARDPGYMLATDDEGRPHGPYATYEGARAQIVIMKWADDIRQEL